MLLSHFARNFFILKNDVFFLGSICFMMSFFHCSSVQTNRSHTSRVATFSTSDPRKRMVQALQLLIEKNPQSEKYVKEHGLVMRGDPCTGKILVCNEQKEGIKLFLDKMELTAVPKEVLAAFPKLQVLSLEGNQLTEFVDAGENPELVQLFLTSNQLAIAPNVSKNVKLEELTLAFNLLTAPPDISNNLNLKILHLFHNQLIKHPDISKNAKLEILMMGNNSFSTKSLTTLRTLKKKNPALKLTFSIASANKA